MKTRRASKPLGFVTIKFVRPCRFFSSLWLLILLSACNSSAQSDYPLGPDPLLVLINDYSEGATAVVIAINPWPATDNSIAGVQELNLNINQGASEE